MSLYGTKVQIGGVPCGLVLRGAVNGQYQAVFEREYAALEDIEAIDWDQPVVEGESILPSGYGFTVEDISYNSATRCYTVTLRTARQYLGDVTEYQEQVAELTERMTRREAEIAGLQSQLAEADEAAIALYEALEAAIGSAAEGAESVSEEDAE